MTFSPIPFSCAAFSQSCSYFLVMPAKAGNQTLRQHGFPPRRDAKKLRCPPHQNAAAAAFLTGLDSGVKAKNKIGSSSFNLVKYLEEEPILFLAKTPESKPVRKAAA